MNSSEEKFVIVTRRHWVCDKSKEEKVNLIVLLVNKIFELI